LQNQSINLQYKKKDFTKGYAVGALKFAGASVPVIIKK